MQQFSTAKVYFPSRFISVDADNSHDSRRKDVAIFIPLYNYHPLTNIYIFTYSFASEMTILCLQSLDCKCEADTQWDLFTSLN